MSCCLSQETCAEVKLEDCVTRLMEVGMRRDRVGLCIEMRGEMSRVSDETYILEHSMMFRGVSEYTFDLFVSV